MWSKGVSTSSSAPWREQRSGRSWPRAGLRLLPMATPSLKNERVKVGELVADYRAGRIVIPEFQRDYVWRKNKAPRLLDSLYRSFPVSTLLFWQSSEYAKARRTDPRPAAGRSMSWLIDGQQRVMTLSRVMNGDEGIEVLFNPETDEFSLANAATRMIANWFRVADLFDDAIYRELRRELPSSKKGRSSKKCSSGCVRSGTTRSPSSTWSTTASTMRSTPSRASIRLESV